MSQFLFAHPSFLSGMGRAIDLFGAFDDYNDSPGPETADELAMRLDWKDVGQDIVDAMNVVAREKSDDHEQPPQSR